MELICGKNRHLISSHFDFIFSTKILTNIYLLIVTLVVVDRFLYIKGKKVKP